MKTKLDYAHEYAIQMAKQGIPLKSCISLSWSYADAMFNELDKRTDKSLPDALLECFNSTNTEESQ